MFSRGRTIYFCFLALLVFVLSFADTAGRTWAQKEGPGNEQPIVIKAKSLEMDDARRTITFRGKVHATEKDFVITCEEMVVYYLSSNNQAQEKGVGAKIQKIVAKGGVKIQRAQGGVATADQAVYFWDEEKLVLTGSPEVTQGNDFVKGDKITLYLRENRSVVEGSDGEMVRAVIYPKGSEKTR